MIETPKGMFHRVAENMARPDARYGYREETSSREFFDMMTRLLFMPNTPTLMNAGTGLQQLAACFVFSPEDSLDSICQTVHRAAKIFQSGGGVGYSFSRVRPKGARVHSTGGKASGPVSFMKVYDQICHVVRQGGKRKGAQMGIVYGSEESFAIAAELMKYINRQSKAASHQLAKERGVFEGWEESKYAKPAQYPDWFRKHTGLDPEEWRNGFPLRNHSTTTVAPTGTTSMIANTSAGCEPLFNVVYFKRVSKDVHSKGLLTEFDDYFLTVLGENDLDVADIRDEALRLMSKGEFVSVRKLSVPHPISDIFTTAVEIPPRAHVLMQSAFQEHVDSAISKTINFSPTATRHEIEDAFRLALSQDCKGITVYRIDSRKQQVLGTGTHKDREFWEQECDCGKG